MDDKAAFPQMCLEAGLAHVPVFDSAGSDIPEDCIIKPRKSTQGQGVRRANASEAARVDSETEVVQERLENCKELRELVGVDAGLCTLRVNTMKSPETAIGVLGSFARLARAGSLVDNYHAGGVVVSVDPATGCLLGGSEDRLKQADWTQRYAIEAHPDTGVRFAGCFIYPQFREACELALRAHDKLGSDLMLCSWDIVPGPEGPLLLEAASCMGGGLEFLYGHDFELYRRTLLHHIRTMLK